MADTQRTYSAIAALLADNTVGDISPQDIRDFMETIRSGHGEMSITSAAAETLSLDTWTPASAGTYALTSGLNHNWTMATNGQLKYTGTAQRMCHIAMSFSVTSAANNKTYEFAVGLDGTQLTPSILSRKIGTGADVGSTAVHAATLITTNQYICPMVRNITDGTACTFTYLNLFVVDMAT